MHENSSLRSRWAGFPLIASLFVTAMAVTNQSLWIDEANSALKAIQPSLGCWWQTLAREKGSDLQMPFYMFYLWAWGKIAGHSEIALRLGNVPWLIVAQCALWQATPAAKRTRVLLLALASVNPLLWFYLDEARPYVMQYAAACVLCVLLYRTAQNPSDGARPASLWIFTAGLVLLCGSSLLGVIWAAFAGAAWLYLTPNRLQNLRPTSRLLPLAIAFACLAALGVYYLWTIRVGGRASNLGRTGPLNLAFVLYELVGAAGLGPGRLEIRQNGVTAFRDMGALTLPLLCGLLLVLSLLAHALSRVWQHRANRAIIAGCIYSLPAAALLFALAYAQNFRILGRHFMPLLPVILGLSLYGFLEMRYRRVRMALCVALMATWLGSSLSLRFGERHLKDDYRSAASIANVSLARHETVWWSADVAAAGYYKVPLGTIAEGRAVVVNGAEREKLARQEIPDLVIASKPDIYDATNALENFLREQSFACVQTLPAFTIWRRGLPDSALR